MDQIMGKVGGYWFKQNAGKEINNIGDDINVSNLSIPFDPFFRMLLFSHLIGVVALHDR
jgi:hypothetical protein